MPSQSPPQLVPAILGVSVAATAIAIFLVSGSLWTFVFAPIIFRGGMTLWMFACKHGVGDVCHCDGGIKLLDYNGKEIVHATFDRIEYYIVGRRFVVIRLDRRCEYLTDYASWEGANEALSKLLACGTKWVPSLGRRILIQLERSRLLLFVLCSAGVMFILWMLA